MLSDDDRQWLKDLQDDLWPPQKEEPDDGSIEAALRRALPKKKRPVIVLEATRRLTHEELQRVCTLIENEKLLTSMFSKGMFGGHGMYVFEHEQFPGTGPEHLLTLTEDHLPDPSLYQRLDTLDAPPKKKEKHPGCGTDESWELFSKYTHSDENREWLKKYKMDPPRERGYYDY